MSRLPAITREMLAAHDQAIWDRITAVRSVQGPSGILMNVPPLLERIEALGDYFRFDAELPPADRELVILATVREASAGYAWARHEPGARRAGTRDEAIEVIRARDGLGALTPHERLLVEITRALLREGVLSDALFTRGQRSWGRASSSRWSPSSAITPASASLSRASASRRRLRARPCDGRASHRKRGRLSQLPLVDVPVGQTLGDQHPR